MRTLLFWSSGRSDPKVIEADGRAPEKINNPRTGCNLHFALLFLLFFSVRFLDVHFCPLFCIKNYLSYFLFLVCIGLFKSPSQTGQEWDREEVTRVISQIGDISQVLWWKKKFQCVFVVPYFWSIVIKLKYLPYIAKQKDIQKALQFVSHCFMNHLNMRKAGLVFACIKNAEPFLPRDFYMLIKWIFLCFLQIPVVSLSSRMSFLGQT